MAVETLKNACLLCGNDLKGNDEMLFFCKRCNLLFKRKDTAIIKFTNSGNLEEKNGKNIVSETILKNHNDISKRTKHERNIDDVNDKEQDELFYSSKKGLRYHAGNCPYISFMNKENLMCFKSQKQAEADGFSKCKCLKNR